MERFRGGGGSPNAGYAGLVMKVARVGPKVGRGRAVGRVTGSLRRPAALRPDRLSSPPPVARSGFGRSSAFSGAEAADFLQALAQPLLVAFPRRLVVGAAGEALGETGH